MTRASETLFRDAALEARRPRLAGRIVLAQPLSMRLLTLAAVLAAASVVALLCFGRYTDHATVTGMLVPEHGVIDVRAAQRGRIVELHVREGERVAAGQPLFVVSSERQSPHGATTRRVLEEIERTLASLEQQQTTLVALERGERRALADRSDVLETEADALRAMIDAQTERVGLAEAGAARYAAMRTERFVSAEQVNAKREQLLDQRARLKSLERELIAVRRSHADVAHELAALPMRYRAEHAELERAVASARRERSEAQARRTLVVAAPLDGTATAVQGEIGQVVDGSVPLAAILPDTALHAELYVPSRAAGFIGVGDRVALRLRAYPHARFGHADGTIASLARTALAARELAGGRLDPAALGTGPFYRVTVTLARQSIVAGDKRATLRAGMLLDAELPRETRRLYQWILDPYGKLGL